MPLPFWFSEGSSRSFGPEVFGKIGKKIYRYFHPDSYELTEKECIYFMTHRLLELPDKTFLSNEPIRVIVELTVE